MGLERRLGFSPRFCLGGQPLIRLSQSRSIGFGLAPYLGLGRRERLGSFSLYTGSVFNLSPKSLVNARSCRCLFPDAKFGLPSGILFALGSGAGLCNLPRLSFEPFLRHCDSFSKILGAITSLGVRLSFGLSTFCKNSFLLCQGLSLSLSSQRGFGLDPQLLFKLGVCLGPGLSERFGFYSGLRLHP